MIDIVDRLKFDAVRCEQQFSKGVAGNISDAAQEIERLRDALTRISEIENQEFGPDWEEIDAAREIALDALKCAK